MLPEPSYTLELRMAKLEGSCEQLDKRLSGIETRLGSGFNELRTEIRGAGTELRAEIRNNRAELCAEIRALRTEQRTRFYILVAVVIASILVPIALRFSP